MDKQLSYLTLFCALCMFTLSLHFDNVMDSTWEENKALKNKVSKLENGTNVISFKVTVTTYNPTKAQCDDTPNITADGTKINPKNASQYRYVALSRDLLNRWGGPFEYGEYVAIEGTNNGKHDGVWQVKDTMSPKWIKRIDFLTHPFLWK